MKKPKKINKKERGITLIALVITIVVLLILAGVSINMLTGENGILKQSKEAKKQTELKEDEEKIKLAVSGAKILNSDSMNLEIATFQDELDNQFGKNKVIARENTDGNFTIHSIDKNKEYITSETMKVSSGINWDKAKREAKIPEEQKNKNVIGIGTNGQTVNMDLWKYTYDTVTGGYGLNSKEVFQNIEYNENGTNTETIRTAGYIGKETDYNNIIIPQYISEDDGKNYIPVTSLYRTFMNNQEIEGTPNIPTTVTNIFAAFESCRRLTEFNIPSSVIDISWAFSGTGIKEIKNEIGSNIEKIKGAFASCNSLERVNFEIPKKVKDMTCTFGQNYNLKEANIILPENLENMEMTFYRCDNLEKGPDVIPEKVTNMLQTFQRCSKLHGTMTIKASPEKYGNAFGEGCASKAPSPLIIREGNGNRNILKEIIKNGDWTGKYVKGEWELR